MSRLKIFEEMAGMKHDQPHAFPHALRDPLHHRVLDTAVSLVAPPEKHVGAGEFLGRQAVLGLLQRGGADLDAAFGPKRRRDRVVNSVRIDAAHDLVLALV